MLITFEIFKGSYKPGDSIDYQNKTWTVLGYCASGMVTIQGDDEEDTLLEHYTAFEEDEEVECNMCGNIMDLLPDESNYVCTNTECTRCYEEEE